MASFFHDLFTGALVSPQSLADMQDLQPLDKGYDPGAPYGMGLFEENYFPVVGSGKLVPETAMLGHGGMDYGSGGSPIGYSKRWGFGLAVIMGSAIGNNCSLPDGALGNGNAWQGNVRRVLSRSHAIALARSGGQSS